MLKRQAVVFAAALIIFILGETAAVHRLELFSLDVWLSRNQPASAADIVLIPISKKSLDQIGPWPWPSFRFAVAVEFLSRLKARSVYIHEALLPEESEKEREAFLQVLKKQETKVFLSADAGTDFETALPGLPHLQAKKEVGVKWDFPAKDFFEHTFLGHRKIKPDDDRVFRFWQPQLYAQKLTYPIAALKMAKENRPEFSLPHFQKPNFIIPWNRTNFNAWPQIEFSDLIQNYLAMREGSRMIFPETFFSGKDIFIGLADENYTSMGLSPWGESVFPFQVMAAIYDGLSYLSGSPRQIVSGKIQKSVFIGFVLALLFLAGVRVGKSFWFILSGLLFFAVIIWVLFLFMGFWFPWAALFLLFCLSAASIFVFDALYAKQERSALFHLATRDGLTNLYVIRHFRVIMNQMTREACARKESLAVILMDIDHFKKINDTHGHPAGDMVLKKTAELIQGAVRQKRTLKEVDFVARYGGEEFIVLIRRNSLEQTAQKIAERIRAVIEAADYSWNGVKVTVTVSLGVAVLRPDETIPDAVVHRADKALYLAKESGRNRVCTEDDLSSR